MEKALQFDVIASCTTSKARTSLMKLPHYTVETPVFMPVGTKGSVKSVLPEQLEDMNCQIILGNTYHLGLRPGVELLKKAKGLHNFMGWKRALLTDSGGFQMVSLLHMAEINEQGVNFESPYDGTKSLLTPEKSIQIQNAIGADIIMQLDDVVPTTSKDNERMEEATHRTTRWLDRCLSAHERPTEQNIFPIVQGGLIENLRKLSANLHLERKVNGYAIGGLVGGEDKEDFWKMVILSTNLLPCDKPKYVMGVGFAVDLVICCALGADMFDCVFPTRTARFGCALISSGQISLRHNKFRMDFRPIEKNCRCSTCKTYTRAYIHQIVCTEAVSCSLLSIHNLHYQMQLMKGIRESIKVNKFPEFVQEFMTNIYPDKSYPQWCLDALQSVNIELK
ncbi:queuine tRNA-ribosyltransferase catalytic subunit [Acyrthosiphon pisum]|uniref:Queuine tRNA-ribosyltransferase catalytic subunit 1 n=1 Tax=Acyrthosiphon pisum TaxID=7029 RepID=A0A8R2A3F8_ACYPI|nr:queuine tRNA-ribosyltransferase catalytic subunit [Acyrthosiphon pisum]XP_016656392.1 queuine tRNA-ribosyltransferase catalytic subunit [Acyrthosiphon pisum]XP_016656393.1 queuine tRNA-ribosyltransferase catalytic subunit [Acyrthosiphon pisum]|eukprot:XP_001950376.1 PREDICTED: probable queuine tRNA-ribosyltransferase [Acyrthosiphon pisum]